MLKKNIFFNLILTISQILFPLITFPYASRILGPSGIGSIVFVDSITQIFLLFSALGIPIYGVREISKLKHDKLAISNLLSELLTIHMCCTGLFILFYLGLALFIPQLSAHFLLVLIGVAILIFNVFSLEWFFQGIENFSYITKRTLIVRIVFIILLFCFVSKKTDTVVYYSLMAGSSFLNAIINFNYSRRYVNGLRVSLNLKKHLKPLLIILCSNIVISVYLLMDNTIVGFLKGEVAVGYYSTAVKFAKVALTIITSFGIVLIPQISKAHTVKDYDRVNVIVNKSFNYVCTIGLPLTIGLILLSKTIILTLVSKAFLPSVLVLQIISPILIIIGMTNIFVWQVLTPFGKDKKVLFIVICGMLTSLTFNFLLIPHWSYLGAAVANVVTELVVMVLSAYYVYSLNLIKFKLTPLWNAIFGSLGLILITIILRVTISESLIREILIVVLCGILYSIYQIIIVKNEIIVSVFKAVTTKISDLSLSFNKQYNKRK